MNRMKGNILETSLVLAGSVNLGRTVLEENQMLLVI